MVVQARSGAAEAPVPAIDTGGVTELALLIPDAEMAALEEQARREGVMTGQLIRRVLRAYLARPGPLPAFRLAGADDRPVEEPGRSPVGAFTRAGVGLNARQNGMTS